MELDRRLYSTLIEVDAHRLLYQALMGHCLDLVDFHLATVASDILVGRFRLLAAMCPMDMDSQEMVLLGEFESAIVWNKLDNL